jgi:hypothetical protein
MFYLVHWVDLKIYIVKMTVNIADGSLRYRNIARRVDVTQTTISHIVQQFRKTNGHAIRSAQRRAAATVKYYFLRFRAVSERFTVTPRSLERQFEAFHHIQSLNF